MRRYKGDPYWLKARYAGKCKRCGKAIKVGDDIYYYPMNKSVYCDDPKCGQACDEDVYNGVGNPYAC